MPVPSPSFLDLRGRNASRSAGERGRVRAAVPPLLRRVAPIGLALLLAAAALPLVASADEPPGPSAALKEVLATFRTEGPKGWSFTQVTVGDGHSRVERFDAAQPEFARWTLLQQDGRVPTADERREYRDKLSRRSRGGTAPRLTDQFDLATIERVADAGERSTYRLRVQPGEADDLTAEFLRATIVFHHPTRTIESLEIASIEPFSPAFGVKIEEMNTTLHYSLPTADQPSLLQQSLTRLRGRAFWFKSLDAEMTVTFSDYTRARAR